MSSALSVATEHKVTWEGNYFANRQDAFEDLLYNIPGLIYEVYRGGDEIEIDNSEGNLDIIRDYIKELRREKKQAHPAFKLDESSYYFADSVTNEDVADVLQAIIDKHDRDAEVIYLCWS
jgi:hypothetical protein